MNTHTYTREHALNHTNTHTQLHIHTHFISFSRSSSRSERIPSTHTLSTSNDLQLHIATQHTATHRNTLQHTASHCHTLQHTPSLLAMKCNTHNPFASFPYPPITHLLPHLFCIPKNIFHFAIPNIFHFAIYTAPSPKDTLSDGFPTFCHQDTVVDLFSFAQFSFVDLFS